MISHLENVHQRQAQVRVEWGYIVCRNRLILVTPKLYNVSGIDIPVFFPRFGSTMVSDAYPMGRRFCMALISHR